MTPHIGETFHLSKFKLGLAGLGQPARVRGRVADLGADRRSDRAAQGDLRRHLRLVDRHHRLGAVDLVPDAALLPRAGRRRRGRLRPDREHAALRGRAAREARPRARHLQRRHGARRDQRARAGRDAGAHPRLARRLLDRRRPVGAARARVGVRGRARPAARARKRCPRAPTCSSPTYLMALAGGILATFGASALIFWVALAGHRGAPLLGHRRQHLHGVRRAWSAASGGVIVGRLRGRRAQPARARRPRAGHRAVDADRVPVGVAALLVTWTAGRSWC